MAVAEPQLPLVVAGGHVWAKGLGTIGRFRDDAHAAEVLGQAGYKLAIDGTFTPPAAHERVQP
jgi:hypothetical protein